MEQDEADQGPIGGRKRGLSVCFIFAVTAGGAAPCSNSCSRGKPLSKSARLTPILIG